MNKLLWRTTVGDDGLEVALIQGTDNKLHLSITRHDVMTKTFNDATEVRILGEAIRLAGLAQMQHEGKAVAA